MVTITFEGTSVENLNRQIVRYAEMIMGLKLVEKPGKHQMGTKGNPVDQPRFIPSEVDGNMTVGYQYKK